MGRKLRIALFACWMFIVSFHQQMLVPEMYVTEFKIPRGQGAHSSQPKSLLALTLNQKMSNSCEACQ